MLKHDTAELSLVPATSLRVVEERDRMKQWLAQRIALGATKAVTEIVSLTPVLAELLMETNVGNRTVSQTNLERIKRDVAEGLFEFNGESIIISRDGKLNNGQHRCLAVIESGHAIRVVRRDAERGENIAPDVLEKVEGTHLDKGTYLDVLKRLSHPEQRQRVEKALSTNDRQEKEKRAASKIDADVKARAAREVAEMIAEYIPAEAWDGLKANLYAAGAKSIANELTNITGQSIMDRRYA